MNTFNAVEHLARKCMYCCVNIDCGCKDLCDWCGVHIANCDTSLCKACEEEEEEEEIFPTTIYNGERYDLKEISLVDVDGDLETKITLEKKE